MVGLLSNTIVVSRIIIQGNPQARFSSQVKAAMIAVVFEVANTIPDKDL
jgi:hypothetical protein